MTFDGTRILFSPQDGLNNVFSALPSSTVRQEDWSPVLCYYNRAPEAVYVIKNRSFFLTVLDAGESKVEHPVSGCGSRAGSEHIRGQKRTCFVLFFSKPAFAEGLNS